MILWFLLTVCKVSNNSSTRDEPDVSRYKGNGGPKQWFHTKPRRGIMTAASKKNFSSWYQSSFLKYLSARCKMVITEFPSQLNCHDQEVTSHKETDIRSLYSIKRWEVEECFCFHDFVRSLLKIVLRNGKWSFGGRMASDAFWPHAFPWPNNIIVFGFLQQFYFFCVKHAQSKGDILW